MLPLFAVVNSYGTDHIVNTWDQRTLCGLFWADLPDDPLSRNQCISCQGIAAELFALPQ